MRRGWLWLAILTKLSLGQEVEQDPGHLPEEGVVQDVEQVAEPEPIPKLELPEWDEEELEALESGELVPGSSIVGKIARDLLFSENDEPIEFDPSVRELPEDRLSEKSLWETAVDPQFATSYFRHRPSGFLNDPQQLLTSQEYRDREGFLEYHAKDAEIDLYLYLFDGKQEIPDGESLQRVIAENFRVDRPVAVVFYFLGMPERAQFAVSRIVRESLPEGEILNVLSLAVDEALEKSDPTSQLESFSIQCSIRLYRLEKLLMANRAGHQDLGSVLASHSGGQSIADDGWLNQLQKNPLLLYVVMVSGILFPITALAFLGRYYVERKREYIFPDAQGSPLLGAPYAAGVGGVISYASVSLPPSSQREEVPRYLQKI